MNNTSSSFTCGTTLAAFLRGLRNVLLIGFFGHLATGAYAADAPTKRPEANGSKIPKPSGLTGDLRPRCIAGTYAAGNMCKPAPPGFYVPPDAPYPILCPDGKTSHSGARGTSECF